MKGDVLMSGFISLGCVLVLCWIIVEAVHQIVSAWKKVITCA